MGDDFTAAHLKKWRKRGINDFYFFAKHILGYEKMSPMPHQAVCDHIKRTGRLKKLTLLPRGSFKSSVITVAGVMHEMLQNPSLRVLIASESQINANKYVKEIKTHYEKNEKFKQLYGNWVSRELWRDYAFTVSMRTKIKKEPSVMSASLERGNIVGMHYDMIVLDDVVGPNNINNAEQIDKTLYFYRALLSILDPGGKIWINGTRWSVMDLYGTILDPQNPENNEFHILQMDAENDGDGNLLMPNVLTREFLDSMKASQGEEIYNAQYRNIITGGSRMTFDIQDVQRYKEGEQPDRVYLNHFLTVDPAWETGVKNDFSGIIVNGVDYEGRWWIREALELKLDPFALVEKLFKLSAQYAPLMAFGMQKFAFEKFLGEYLKKEQINRGVTLPIVMLDTSTNQSKEARIKGLQPHVRSKKLFVKDEHRALLHQLEFHPQVRHDDLVDPLQMQNGLVFPSDKKFQTERDPKRHLSANERKIWEHAEKLTGRRVRTVGGGDWI